MDSGDGGRGRDRHVDGCCRRLCGRAPALSSNHLTAVRSGRPMFEIRGHDTERPARARGGRRRHRADRGLSDHQSVLRGLHRHPTDRGAERGDRRGGRADRHLGTLAASRRRHLRSRRLLDVLDRCRNARRLPVPLGRRARRLGFDRLSEVRPRTQRRLVPVESRGVGRRPSCTSRRGGTSTTFLRRRTR